jgi:hypothetical protein
VHTLHDHPSASTRGRTITASTSVEATLSRFTREPNRPGLGRPEQLSLGVRKDPPHSPRRTPPGTAIHEGTHSSSKPSVRPDRGEPTRNEHLPSREGTRLFQVPSGTDNHALTLAGHGNSLTRLPRKSTVAGLSATTCFEDSIGNRSAITLVGDGNSLSGSTLDPIQIRCPAFGRHGNSKGSRESRSISTSRHGVGATNHLRERGNTSGTRVGRNFEYYHEDS